MRSTWIFGWLRLSVTCKERTKHIRHDCYWWIDRFCKWKAVSTNSFELKIDGREYNFWTLKTRFSMYCEVFCDIYDWYETNRLLVFTTKPRQSFAKSESGTEGHAGVTDVSPPIARRDWDHIVSDPSNSPYNAFPMVGSWVLGSRTRDRPYRNAHIVLELGIGSMHRLMQSKTLETSNLKLIFFVLSLLRVMWTKMMNLLFRIFFYISVVLSKWFTTANSISQIEWYQKQLQTHSHKVTQTKECTSTWISSHRKSDRSMPFHIGYFPEDCLPT